MSDLFRYDYPLELLAEQRIREALREADTERLLREISPCQPGWWSLHAAHLLLIVGEALTTIGQRLERRNQPDRSSLRQQDALKAISTFGE